MDKKVAGFDEQSELELDQLEYLRGGLPGSGKRAFLISTAQTVNHHLSTMKAPGKDSPKEVILSKEGAISTFPSGDKLVTRRDGFRRTESKGEGKKTRARKRRYNKRKG